MQACWDGWVSGMLEWLHGGCVSGLGIEMAETWIYPLQELWLVRA